MTWGLRQPERAKRNLAALTQNLGPRLGVSLLNALQEILPQSPDADLALNNLDRLMANPKAREQFPELVADNAVGLRALMQLLAISQFFADTLTHYPETIHDVHTPNVQVPTPDELHQQLKLAVESCGDDSTLLKALRRFRQVQMLRIGVNDILRDRPLEEIVREISRVADATIDVALHCALKTLRRKFGTPTTASGQPARFVGLAFGKLGGEELNYSSDIDLMFVYDEDGQTIGKRTEGIPNAEFYGRVVTEVVRLLSSNTDRGVAYRTDLRLRPGGAYAALTRSLEGTLSYYDAMGRTWERQALIKLRPVAGDLTLGQEIVERIEPFVYRKYFSFSEINEIKALKRRMEQRTSKAGTNDRDVKNGLGGIRDIEYTVQFLQLLNGGDLPAVRQRNTLIALESLEIAGCLTAQETYILADAYRFLRKVEHRLQILFDWQTHTLPGSARELHTLARRMGYELTPPLTTLNRPVEHPPNALAPQRRSPLDESPLPITTARPLLVEPLDLFLTDYHEKTRLDRAILDHLLHQTFVNDAEQAMPESDLILVQEPDAETIAEVLGVYPFTDVQGAYQNLSKLAQESVPFLSHRRCRHFLASIAPQLLRAIAETPNPDLALNNLERVTASLGGKAVLYELFSFNSPSLKLYVDICASSPFLASILMKNPGMIDELLDCLLLDQPRSQAELSAELRELCRGAHDLDPILHSFMDKEALRIAVRDLLHKDTIQETTAALSDLAETILNAVFDIAEPMLEQRYGRPRPWPSTSLPCRYAVIALGKLGGRELSYHSDLDLVLVYEAVGTTIGGTHPATTHQHYFTELMQKVIQALTRRGPLGRMYTVDMRLRPTGTSGNLVLPLSEFQRYYDGPSAQLWERQALTRARIIRGHSPFVEQLRQAIHSAICDGDWQPGLIDEVRSMRDRVEAAGKKESLKTGSGGMVDVEFLVQLYQIRLGRTHPMLLTPNIWHALDLLAAFEEFDPADLQQLREGYSFYRRVEARMRIVSDRPMTTLPTSAAERENLAWRLGFVNDATMTAVERFHMLLKQHQQAIRRIFQIQTERLRHS